MNDRPRLGVVIVAGGSGERFAGRPAKQFALLGGRPVLVHAASALAKVAGVVEMVFVLPDAAIPTATDSALNELAASLPDVVFRRCAGGGRRQDSVAAGLAALVGPYDIALVHDAARPFPPLEPTRSAIQSAVVSGGALLAVRAGDTVKQSGDRDEVAATLERSRIWLAQTPQAIRADWVGPAIDLLRGQCAFTDESAVLERLGVAVKLIEGTASNIKITHREDLARAERWLAAERSAAATQDPSPPEKEAT